MKINSKLASKKKAIDDRPKTTSLPSGRKSIPDNNNNYPNFDNKKWTVVSPSYIREMIPVIRQLMVMNTDVGQAIHNIVTLGNTGHQVFFDRKVPVDQVDAMRNHLLNKRKEWAPGSAGIDGLVNKWFSQILVSGALSNEWVPNKNLTGIEANILVNPETIEFKFDPATTKYEPYQRIKNPLSIIGKADLVKLNQSTYKYYGYNGDGETPQGFPPYISVLPRLKTQSNMDKNIDFVIDQMGLIGFLEGLIQKPDQDDGESDTKYETRLNNLLSLAKSRILEGFKDGVVTGFKDDHEFKFNSPPTKAVEGAATLYQNNELMIASSLKQDSALWGRGYASSETQITVVFIKMLSELKNIQNLVKENLNFGYALELRLAGFKFDYLDCRFNKSTLQDDYKYQQGQEIKIRNVQSKMILGMIDQDTAADELGYEAPALPKPVVSWEVLAGGSDPTADGTPAVGAKKKADTKKKKTASETKSRREKKAVPKNK